MDAQRAPVFTMVIPAFSSPGRFASQVPRIDVEPKASEALPNSKRTIEPVCK